MSDDNVVPLFRPPPDLPLTYTAALAGIAQAIEEKCGLDHADQLAEFGGRMTVVIDIEAMTVNVGFGR